MSTSEEGESTPAGLAGLGWSRFFEQSFAPFRADGLRPARVVREDRDCYLVRGEQGELTAEVTGRFRHATRCRSDFPAVGDWVVLQVDAGGTAAIRAVLPRKSRFSRKVAWQRTEEQIVAANIDTVLLVVGLDRDFNPRRIERYVTTMRSSGAEAGIVLNKTDLCPDFADRLSQVQLAAPRIPIHAVSAADGTGLEALVDYLQAGQTIAFIGSSGVGKSSIINRLLGSARQTVGEVSLAIGKGRHVTTRRELIPLPGGALLIDTPGMRELQLWGDEDDVRSSFEDIEELAARCRFRDCHHGTEPGCAVRQALDAGALEPQRLRNFLKLRRELRFLARRQEAAERKAERKAGRVNCREPVG